MGALTNPSPTSQRWIVRYRGFVLIPQKDLSWMVRPERSPMKLLPFRAPEIDLPKGTEAGTIA